jgi:hypothetical protein
MSTHALVGVKTEEGGFRARFVHYDGYPEAMVPALNRVIKNYKMAGSQDTNPVAYILGNHWSSFSTSSHEPAQSYSHDQTWYTEKNEIDHEYLYLIDPTTLKVTAYLTTYEGWMEINPSNTIKAKAMA